MSKLSATRKPAEFYKILGDSLCFLTWLWIPPLHLFLWQLPSVWMLSLIMKGVTCHTFPFTDLL